MALVHRIQSNLVSCVNAVESRRVVSADGSCPLPQEADQTTKLTLLSKQAQQSRAISCGFEEITR